MNRSIRLTTIAGIPIEINYTWFVVFALIVWTLRLYYFPTTIPDQPAFIYWVTSLIAAILFFASLLAHELSHSAIAIKNDLPIKNITLFIFGGVARMTKEPQTPKVEFKMAAAGPACSFVLSLIFFALTQLFYNLKFPMALVALTDYLSFINLMVGVFNLVPGFPLDGGRILRAALWSISGDIKQATRVATTFGKAFAYFLIVLGFFYLFYGVIISGIWLIFIGFFLQEAAAASYQQVAIKKDLLGIKVKDIMSSAVVTVRDNISLLSLVDDYFFKYRFTSFPVLSVDDEIKGIITIHAVKDMPKDHWKEKKVSDAMIPLRQSFLINAGADAYDALVQMAGNGIGRLIVATDHKLIGIVSQRDVMRLFEVKEDLGG
jgi:Zn-dependent protease/CBS domain-containing protein